MIRWIAVRPVCKWLLSIMVGIYNLKDLRGKSYLTREGVSLLGINEAAEAIGLRTVGVKVSLENLVDDAPLPCIFLILNKTT